MKRFAAACPPLSLQSFALLWRPFPAVPSLAMVLVGHSHGLGQCCTRQKPAVLQSCHESKQALKRKQVLLILGVWIVGSTFSCSQTAHANKLMSSVNGCECCSPGINSIQSLPSSVSLIKETTNASLWHFKPCFGLSPPLWPLLVPGPRHCVSD